MIITRPRPSRSQATSQQREVEVSTPRPLFSGDGRRTDGQTGSLHLSAAWANRRPRSSKFLNISRLAQAGDSSTRHRPTGPVRLQRCTALVQVLHAHQRWRHNASAICSASRPKQHHGAAELRHRRLVRRSRRPFAVATGDQYQLAGDIAARPSMAGQGGADVGGLESS